MRLNLERGEKRTLKTSTEDILGERCLPLKNREISKFKDKMNEGDISQAKWMVDTMVDVLLKFYASATWVCTHQSDLKQ